VGRLGFVAVLVGCVQALACGRADLLDPPASGTGNAAGVDAGAAGALPGLRAPPVLVAGTWRLYGFEDPVTVRLEVGPDGRSYDVTGVGCYNGAVFNVDSGSCGELHGHGAGLELEFAFDFSHSLSGGGHYAMSAHASQDGTRMAGTITTQIGTDRTSGPMGPYGWLRLEDIGVTSALDQAKPPPADLGPLPNESWHGPTGLALALQGDAPLGSVVPGKTYFEQESAVGVDSFTGALGVFWNPDFHWDEATRTLTAGPVPETIAGMPVKLELHVGALSTDVRDVVATTADGATGTFLYVPPGP
jgi:hypothetical protein